MREYLAKPVALLAISRDRGELVQVLFSTETRFGVRFTFSFVAMCATYRDLLVALSGTSV